MGITSVIARVVRGSLLGGNITGDLMQSSSGAAMSMSKY